MALRTTGEEPSEILAGTRTGGPTLEPLFFFFLFKLITIANKHLRPRHGE